MPSTALGQRHDRRLAGDTSIAASRPFAPCGRAPLARAASGTSSSRDGLHRFLDAPVKVLFAAALVAFQFEELLRRVFMGLMQPWKLILIDGAALITVQYFIAGFVLTQSITVEAFFGALLAGQLVGIVIAIVLLPASERFWGFVAGADFRGVAAFEPGGVLRWPCLS